MPRLTLSFLLICLVLAIMATAMPIKRASPDSATEMDSTLAEEIAAKSLQSAAKMMDEMAGKAVESSKEDDSTSTPSTSTPSTSTPQTKPQTETETETENKQQPKTDADTSAEEKKESTPTTPTATESSAASSPKPQASTHIVNDNPFANLPIVGGLLSGGGDSSLGAGLLG
ncbi:uncharacterized protein BO80DRAFT_498666 [Aspergillus ibericus CBS 121593]|uniref:Uncharacterized protein n=1 Tax=Aspergillus ibericus CBS 121593 TaxID=1448316 RepID=A0A395HCP6_9EURO|nr:hypothetical protein BO80DRAFT_498666 [Aspergillus ibericus CBS 121593]RAL05731.1 hypothetical protein BO80DRAFT_498666 [Aspergillus ibericus CBS 121593]